MSGTGWEGVIVVLSVAIAILTQYEVDNDVLLVEMDVALPVSRGKAFMFLADMNNMQTWFPGTSKFEAIDTMPMQAGKHFTETYLFPMYGNLQCDSVIMSYEAPRFISYVSDTWLMRRVEMQLEKNENVPQYPTMLTYRIFSRRRSYLFHYVLSPVVSYVSGYTVRQALFSLRYALQDN